MGKTDLNSKRDELEQLVKKVKEGDQDAFSQVYDILLGPIYRYVFYRVNGQVVEDLVENVFIKVWINIRKYNAQKNKVFSAWVFRIAHNLVIDHYRSSKSKAVDELTSAMPDERREHSPIHNTQQVLDNANLKKAISTLKKSYQDVIVYKYISSLSNSEISQIMKRSEGSIRILQFRALKALRTELKHMGIKYDFLV